MSDVANTVGTAVGQLTTATLNAAQAAGEAAKPTLEKVLGNLLQKAVAGVDFTVEQAPEVVRQFLVFKTWETGIYVAILLLVSFATSYVIYRLWKYIIDKDHDLTFVGLVFSIVPLVSIIAAIEKSILLIKLIVAPKVYLIEYAIQLLK